eukprot:10797483-Alexandrium_andersonii.AAC.1
MGRNVVQGDAGTRNVSEHRGPGAAPLPREQGEVVADRAVLRKLQGPVRNGDQRLAVEHDAHIGHILA